MELGLEGWRADPAARWAPVILLDTNAVIWLDQHHARTRRLARSPSRLYVSPATLLELQFLDEIGRLRLRSGTRGIVDSESWELDAPPAIEWFEQAAGESWTGDPFDRLIVAHARVRGFRLATADRAVLERLPASARLQL
jgi:PIN domain nuclease of toxin-antitoxin system